MLKITISTNWLIFEKNDDNKLISKKSNNNNKIIEFNINNNIKLIKKLEKLFKFQQLFKF